MQLVHIYFIPWCSDRVEGGYNAGNVNCAPFWDVYFGDQNCQRQYDTVEEESEQVSYDLSDEEEAVDDVKLLIQAYFLRKPATIQIMHVQQI